MLQQNPIDDQITNRSNVDQPQHPKVSFQIKCGITLAIALIFLIYRFSYAPYTGDKCFVDNYHEFTYDANRSLYNGWDNTILGIGQLLMDGWVIFMCVYWFWNLKNMRYPSVISVYFGFRGFLLVTICLMGHFQNFEKFPFPEDIVWHNPGFFSFSVPYDHTRDFYYSGHTGTLALIALQMWTLDRKVICAMVCISLIYMVNMLTITRIHYSIDILGALIFAPFWFRLTKVHLARFDWAFSFPYFITKKIYQRCKRPELNEQTSEVELETNLEPPNEEKKREEKQSEKKSQIGQEDQFSGFPALPFDQKQ